MKHWHAVIIFYYASALIDRTEECWIGMLDQAIAYDFEGMFVE